MDSSSSINRKLEGKVAIVTGGANGIGEATATLFVENGAVVVIADINDDKGVQLASKLGCDVATFKHCDVSCESDMEDLVAFTIQTWGRLDIMLNNAGTLGKVIEEDVRDIDVIDFDYVMSVNVRGMALGVKHASKAMVNAKIKGSIICVASISSILGGLGAPTVYTVSKHAIVGLVRAAASDLGKYGIRVNCISPAAIPTHLLLSYMCKASPNASLSLEQAQAHLDSKTVLAQHSFTSLDVAKSILYLASDDASFVSGINLLVDGAFTSCKKLFDKEAI